MATTLLVAGPTLTLGIPLCLHPPACTQRLSIYYRRLAYGSFQLMHITHDDQLSEQWWPERRQYSAHNFTVVSVAHSVSAWRQSQYGQNLCVPFLRATVLATVRSCTQTIVDNGKRKGLRTSPSAGPYITFFARGGNQEENCLINILRDSWVSGSLGLHAQGQI